MKNTGTLKVTLPSDREVRLSRVFDAPRSMVYDALTKPELLKRWFGPRGFSLLVCEVDLRVGGRWRFVLKGPDGNTMGMSGTYLELSPPDGSVHTEAFNKWFDRHRATAGVVALVVDRLVRNGDHRDRRRLEPRVAIDLGDVRLEAAHHRGE